jgi:RNA polymerase sigma-70 factor (ECF subfamily)
LNDFRIHAFGIEKLFGDKPGHAICIAVCQKAESPDGGLAPWALQVIEIVDGEIVAMNAFLDTARLFPLFGLPPRLDA